jgi:hypothetical protein
MLVQLPHKQAQMPATKRAGLNASVLLVPRRGERTFPGKTALRDDFLNHAGWLHAGELLVETAETVRELGVVDTHQA